MGFKKEYINSIPMYRCAVHGFTFHVRGDKDKEGVPYQVRWMERNCPRESTQSYKDLGFIYSWNPGFNKKAIHILNKFHKQLGPKNIPQLNKITRMHAYTLAKEEVLKDLPKKYFQQRVIKMTPEIKKAYLQLLDSSRAEIKGGWRTPEVGSSMNSSPLPMRGSLSLKATNSIWLPTRRFFHFTYLIVRRIIIMGVWGGMIVRDLDRIMVPRGMGCSF